MKRSTAADTTPSTDFWNRRFSQPRSKPFETALPDINTPVLVAALDFFGDVEGKTVLDVGCGSGRSSLYFADRGAHVISIDSSEVAIANLRSYCVEHGVTGIDPQVRSVMDLADLPPIDFVFGAMILHHLEPFSAFADELGCVLADGGRAFFHENNARSKTLIWFRQHVVGKLWVPKYGDDDEFPLTVAEVDQLRRRFHVRVEYPRMVLLQMIANYLLGGHFRRTLTRLDGVLFKVPFIRKYSYHQFLFLEA